ncbi:hypothetical protein ACQPZP_02795 [Spirillospora sp. CA-142024]|uniref:hypothetical protein n=1 Tax=Spirillospora sp. CA-142024 TaxID=3240036 RepID=UPI003D8DBF2B
MMGATTVEHVTTSHTAVKKLGDWTRADRIELRGRRGATVLDLRHLPATPGGRLQLNLDLERSSIKLKVSRDVIIDHDGLRQVARGGLKDRRDGHAARPGVVRRVRSDSDQAGQVGVGEGRVLRRYVVLWRTWRGRRTAVRYLEVLALAVRARGWRCVRAVAGGRWAYHEAQRGRAGYLFPCGDAKAAAEQVDLLLKHRMFPSTW